VEIDLDRVRRLVELHQRGLDAEGGGSSQDGWESDDAYGRVGAGLKGAISDLIDEVAYLRVPALKRPITLPSGPPVRSDYERALERIRELEESVRTLYVELNDSEEERLLACENAGNLQLRLDESLSREGKLNIRLSNLDILAREITERVTKMVGALDNVKPNT